MELLPTQYVMNESWSAVMVRSAALRDCTQNELEHTLPVTASKRCCTLVRLNVVLKRESFGDCTHANRTFTQRSTWQLAVHVRTRFSMFVCFTKRTSLTTENVGNWLSEDQNLIVGTCRGHSYQHERGQSDKPKRTKTSLSGEFPGTLLTKMNLLHLSTTKTKNKQPKQKDSNHN